jgi:hypothetical protein
MKIESNHKTSLSSFPASLNQRSLLANYASMANLAFLANVLFSLVYLDVVDIYPDDINNYQITDEARLPLLALAYDHYCHCSFNLRFTFIFKNKHEKNLL